MFFQTRAWKHLRAALVLAHVTSMVLVGIPAPVGGTNRAQWANPTAQAEFKMWSSALHMSPADFEELIWRLANFWMDLRALWLRPVIPYISITGTDQPWRMFVGPDRFPARFSVQVRQRDAADFVTIFEERSDELRWHESFFAQERERSAIYRYSFPDYRGAAEQHCHYIAARVFEEQPAAAHVRCRFFRQRSRSPEQVLGNIPAEPGAWESQVLVSR